MMYPDFIKKAAGVTESEKHSLGEALKCEAFCKNMGFDYWKFLPDRPTTEPSLNPNIDVSLFLKIPEYFVIGYLFFTYIGKFGLGGHYQHLILSSAATACVLALFYFIRYFFVPAIAIAIISAIGWMVAPLCLGATNHLGPVNNLFFIANQLGSSPANWLQLIKGYTMGYAWLYLCIPFFGFLFHIQAHFKLKKALKAFSKRQFTELFFAIVLLFFFLIAPVAAFKYH